MINFNSTNPVIIQFPRFAGGKFISNCLSLSKHAVPQDKTLAEYLLFWADDYQFRFDNLIKTLPLPHDMINWITHYELGDTQLFGPTHLDWRNGNLKNDSINDITIKLSNSNLKFFIVSHSGADEIYNLLKIWPKSKIIMLINHNKFSKLSATLKSDTDNIDQHAGNYCESKYNFLSGPDWPTWKEFESLGFNPLKCNNYSYDIQLELIKFYPWNKIKTDPILFDIDKCIFDKYAFLTSMYTLYTQLNFTDFNESLVSKFWQEYIALHIDNN